MTLSRIAIFVACFVAISVANSGDRPNILLILADDLGYSDLGCFGGEIETPNLDALAAGGLRMTQLYNAARCCSTRASLLTGLYPHQAGVGAMTADNGLPGYRGFLTDRCKTIPSLLQEAGYQTYLAGKWHLRGKGNPDCTPINRGFDHFYGHYKAYASFWREDLYVREPGGKQWPDSGFEPRFYATHAITDAALGFLDHARKSPDAPWFLYLSYNAPHFPLHAPKEVIDKYVERYESGWDELRESRYRRMIEQGIIPESFALSPRGHVTKVPERNADSPYYDRQIPAWDSLPADRRADLTRRMATYAAMVEILDRNVGRVVSDLKFKGDLDSTLIVFLSDNGACAEWDPFGFDNNPYPKNKLYSGKDELAEMGQPGTFHSYGTGWANACNTPFRLYKHYNHEGGISTPFLVHWPEQIGAERAGKIDRQPAHIIDLAKTILKLGGGKMPGEAFLQPEGISLVSLWKSGDELAERPIFFEHEGNRAVRRGKWKAVRTNFDKEWELYDLESDRSEMQNLAEQHPDRVKEFDQLWQAWAKRCFVAPARVPQPAKGLPKIYYWPEE
ncbi:MAG: arylsulfatase [Verrucomicrobiales bacterium]|nr:arylsulfatase [Verrucomicrobiales bacterium]